MRRDTTVENSYHTAVIAGAEPGPDGSRDAPLDLLGIGFGPSNLALAICAREQDEPMSCHFLERRPAVEWHPGMLIEGARMQISFLKDLVSLRNPSSAFSFLQYTKARGRLEHFVNVSQFRPTRIEYNDYLGWVAEQFADQVRYNAEVVRVIPVDDGSQVDLFRVDSVDTVTGRLDQIYTRNVVHAAGGRPRVPSGVDASGELPGVLHSSQFLQRLPKALPERDRDYSVVVVGAGQSGGEITDHIMTHYPQASVHLTMSGYAPRPTDNSPFVNEQFYSGRVDDYYSADDKQRLALAGDLNSANYGVVREEILGRLYDADYLDRVKGRQRLHLHPYVRLTSVESVGGRLCATLDHCPPGIDGVGAPRQEQVACDAVVLATGYERSLDLGIFGDIVPLLASTREELSVSRNYRVQSAPELTAGLYVQGYGESQFGLGDTLLSLLPFRSKDILDDIRSRIPAPARSAVPSECSAARGGATRMVRMRQPLPAYPPPGYLERDEDTVYALMERYRFATLITAQDEDEPVVTQLPLVLDRSRGRKGVLFGHLDRSNPHAELLDGRHMLALFHGPEAYISPSALSTDPLPTWNSMTVRARGRVHRLQDRAEVVRGLCSISEHSDEDFRLFPDDPRIDPLINQIVGFEFEIDLLVGRFKLSQEHGDTDRRLAAEALARRSPSERDFIERVVGFRLDPPQTDRHESVDAPPVRPVTHNDPANHTESQLRRRS